MFAGFCADFHTKRWVRNSFSKDEAVLIEGYAEIAYSENRGMVFGLLNRSNSALRNRLLIGANLISMGLFIYLIWKLRFLQFMVHLPFFMILSGAAGNVIDRIRFGHVVDFIHIHWQDKLNWPYLFNVADIIICTGGFILILVMVFRKNIITKEIKA